MGNLLTKDTAIVGGLESLGNATVTGTTTLTGAVTASTGINVTASAITAAADPGIALTDGVSFYTVTSANADHIVILPTPTPGTVVQLINGATGYELRSSDPATIAINGGVGASAESAIAATTLVTCTCTSATTWICMSQVAAGTVSATQVAA